MVSSVIRMALLSRISIIMLQFVSNRLIPDHDAGVFTSPADPKQQAPLDGWVDYFLGGFRRWDAQYYLHIAEHGYSYENSLAFYPLFPGIINIATRFVHLITFSESLISFGELALVQAVAMNALFFVAAAQTLKKLTDAIFKNPKITNSTIYLFCINPASIFFTAPYTESLFAWLTFSVIYNCWQKRFHFALFYLILSIMCRSNGVINLGFLLFYICQEIIANNNVWKHLFKLALGIAVATLTFGAIQYYHYTLFCQDNHQTFSPVIITYAKDHRLVLAGGNGQNSPWCRQTIPMSYNYVQKHYWNVGFLSYYKLKQIPNFLLAAPVITLFSVQIFSYFRRQLSTIKKSPKHLIQLLHHRNTPDQRLFVFMVHSAILMLICVFFVHIQVSTRLLASASPCLYWFCYVDAVPKNLGDFRSAVGRFSQITQIWCLGYCLIGTAMFCNFLPWT